MPKSTPGITKYDAYADNKHQHSLAETITKQASSQTFYTIRFLVDSQYRKNAYQAYAYFRWVDDMIDREDEKKSNLLKFLNRQQDIIARCYRGEQPSNLHPLEKLATELILSDKEKESGLQTYIIGMMALIAFDARRKGQLITTAHLEAYTRLLSTAVTELLHFCIGHNDHSPKSDLRYSAVTGAHITHLLRDTIEDTNAGFYNIPKEYLEQYKLDPTDLNNVDYRNWVKNRVQLARDYFAAGRKYLVQVENFRCRLAGYAYIGRFELVLDAIERENFFLRHEYPERKRKKEVLQIGLSSLVQSLTLPLR